MEIKIVTSNNMRLSKKENKIINKKINKLKRFLSDFLKHDPTLTVNIDENEKKHIFTVKGYLHIRGNADLSASKEHKELVYAIDGMFKALISEAKKTKEKRQEKSHFSKQELITNFENSKKEFKIENIEELYPELVRFTNRIIIAHHYPDIDAINEINIEYIIDEAIKRLGEKGINTSINIDKALYGEILDVLEEEFTNMENTLEAINIEDEVRYQNSVNEINDEFFEFFQPDALVKIEDILPDVDSDGNYKEMPASKIIDKEILNKIGLIIKDFSSHERKLLTLYIFEEFESYEIAMVMNKKTDEIDNNLNKSLEKLKKKLK